MRARTIKKQSGQVIVVFAICIVVLIGSVGLAIDSGMAYMSKAKLNAAVDAAAIAAARAVTKGANQAEQRAYATSAANDFFAANFVNDPMKSGPVLNNVNVDYAQNGRITFDLDASAKIPTTFSRVFGVNAMNINANAETIRKDIDLAFVVQTSWAYEKFPAAAFDIKAAGKAFLGKLNPVTDRVALIQFNSAAQVHEPFKADQSRGFNRTKMNAQIDAFAFEHKTNLAEGLWRARDQLKRVIKAPSSLRVIVVFTHEAANALSASYKFMSAPTCAKNPGILNSYSGSLIGTIGTGDGFTVDRPWGLEGYDVMGEERCEEYGITGADRISKLPVWYNVHDSEGATPQEFGIQKSSPRFVGSDITDALNAQLYINRASRNAAEDIAKKAREEGIVIFTIGLSSNVQKPSNLDRESGEVVLKCIAGTSDARSDCRSPAMKTGQYCYAPTPKDLPQCYSQIASTILRLTK